MSEKSSIVSVKNIVPVGANGLSPLSVEIEPGSTTFLFSDNSLRLRDYIRTIAGVSPPESGSVRLLQNEVSQLSTDKWRVLRRRIAFISHKIPLVSTLTALGNITLPAIYHNRGALKMIENQAHLLLGYLGFNNSINQLPAYYQPIELMQISIARALIMNPGVVFIDDPFVELDTGDRIRLRDSLASLLFNGFYTTIISTHHPALFRDYDHRFIYLGRDEHAFFSNWHSLDKSIIPEIREVVHPTF